MRLTRIVIFTLAVIATLTVAATAPAQEHIEYPWCANYGRGGGSNCGFSTFEQCLTTLRGMGGFCDPNPFYKLRAPEPLRYRHKRHS